MGVRSEVGGECETGGTFYSNWCTPAETTAKHKIRQKNICKISLFTGFSLCCTRLMTMGLPESVWRKAVIDMHDLKASMRQWTCSRYKPCDWLD